MVINLTTLSGKLASTSVEFMGQTCKVLYDPLVITNEWVTKSQTGTDEAFVESFISVVKSWDVMRTAGKKVPLTQAGLNSVPLPLLKLIYSAIVYGEISEVEEQGKASSDG